MSDTSNSVDIDLRGGTEVTSERVEVFAPSNETMLSLVGPQDRFLRQIQDAFPDTRVAVRGNQISVTGAQRELVRSLLTELIGVIEQGHNLDQPTLTRFIDMVRVDERPSEVLKTSVGLKSSLRKVRPKTAGQKHYVEMIRENIVTFGIGPAGTGKSYLAVALALEALQNREVERIILCRPAVEAGERLGFLPGDLMAKVDPYLRPLYDALFDMAGPETSQKYLERSQVEVAPLAFMRGRTLNRSFIILDEAQNATSEQMKMFLTRIGFGSKAVVTGDVTQVDLTVGRSGLVGLENTLSNIDGLSFVRLSDRDVVRHRIVADIVRAYESAEQRKS